MPEASGFFLIGREGRGSSHVSVGCPAAVDGQGDAGDGVGGVGAEEFHREPPSMAAVLVKPMRPCLADT